MCAAAEAFTPDGEVGDRYVDEDERVYVLAGHDGNGEGTYYALLDMIEPGPGDPVQVRVRLNGGADALKIRRAT